MTRAVAGLVSVALVGLWSARTAAVDYPLPGKTLAMKAKGSKQMTGFVAKTALPVLPAPDPTVSGGKLRIVNRRFADAL